MGKPYCRTPKAARTVEERLAVRRAKREAEAARKAARERFKLSPAEQAYQASERQAKAQAKWARDNSPNRR